MARLAGRRAPYAVFLTAVLLAAGVNHIVARAIGYGIGVSYRRVGPIEGSQVFCAGSSVLQYSLAWPTVSQHLNQGVEHTNVAGATPEMWETFQLSASKVNFTIVGVSPYDLNTRRGSKAFAQIVPLQTTLSDLWASRDSWPSALELLSEYPRAYVRTLFPTVGDADVVLVGARRLARQQLSLAGAAEDRARVLALPQDDLLDFGADETKLSDLPRDRMLRRLALLSAENGGHHVFGGPRLRALQRILNRAQALGPVVIVVLALSPEYNREFISEAVAAEFERTLEALHETTPDAVIVRLDREQTLQNDANFTDFVHMNSNGRAIATRVFLDRLKSSGLGDKPQ